MHAAPHPFCITSTRGLLLLLLLPLPLHPCTYYRRLFVLSASTLAGAPLHVAPALFNMRGAA
jgi:hypothetical protein